MDKMEVVGATYDPETRDEIKFHVALSESEVEAVYDALSEYDLSVERSIDDKTLGALKKAWLKMAYCIDRAKYLRGNRE